MQTLARASLAESLNLSPKQSRFLYSNRFLNVAEGAVRSGKTHSGLWRFLMHAKTAPPGDMMLIGKTERTAKRNLISPMRLMFGKRIRYVQGSGELFIGNRLVHVAGANDVRAHEKIQGSTLVGAYCNEVTLFPEEVFQTLIDRLSIDGARLFADCNPDSPYHWLHADYLTNEVVLAHDLERISFDLYDNPVLSQEYIDRLNRMHAPGSMWHRRMVLGEWVLAEGAIYEQWSEQDHVVETLPGKPERVVVGVDYGTQNATVFLAAGKVGRTWYVFDEYYHSGRETRRQKTNAEYSADFCTWVKRIGYVPSSIEIDPSAAAFKVQLRTDGVWRIRDADHSVKDGIEVVSRGLTGGEIKVLRKCEHLIAEFPNYVWDEKKQERGEDAPLKNDNDHALDALRYLAMRVLNRPALKLVRKDPRL
jgi:PBSX family phage terminase large subunit